MRLTTLSAIAVSLLAMPADSAADDKPKKSADRTIPFAHDIGPIAFSPEGKHLAVGREGAVDVYDYNRMKRLHTIAVTWQARGRIGRVAPLSIAYSPDGKTLGVLKVMPEMQLFDAKTGVSKEIVRFPRNIEATLGVPGGGGFVVFSPNGKLVGLLNPGVGLMGARILGFLWLIDEKQKSKTIRRLRNAIVTSDGRFIGLKMRPGEAGLIAPSIVDLKTGKTLRNLDLKKPLNAAISRFSKDGRRVAVAGMNRLVVWDTSSGKQRLSFKSDGEIFERGIAFSGDGRYVTAASYEYVDAAKTLNGRIRTWRISDGKVVWQIVKPKTVPRVRGTTPDGKSAIYQLGARDQLRFRLYKTPKNGR